MDPSLGQENTTATTNLQTKESSNGQIVDFNEVYPNPPLGDELNEFIELINLSNQAIDLKNWVLADDEGTNYTIAPADWLTTIIEPGKLLLLPRPKTGLALDNGGTEKLTLTSPDGKTKIKLSYEGPVLEGSSYARDDRGIWLWTTTPTPGTANNIKVINKAPILAFDIPKTGTMGELLVFDASDTIDPEQDSLSFTWDFGDGYTSILTTPSHIFAKTGRFTIRLSAKDTFGNEIKENKTITIGAPEIRGVVAGASSGTLELSEFMPNPKGSDENEWVEIFNPNNLPISTAGWKLKINGRNTNLPIYEIPAEGYLTIPKTEARFSLINKGGSIALESPSGEVSSFVEYGAAPEGSSFARNDNGWGWTTLPTPGNENIMTSENETGDGNDYQLYSLIDLKTLESGARVTVEGIVAAQPGLLGKNILFLAGSGIQVNVSGENLPTIKIGDRVKIAGTLSRTVSSGSKIIVRSGDKIAILGQDNSPTPLLLSLGEVTEEQEGELITTTGIVNQTSSTSFTISEGSDNLRVSLKNRELKWPKITIGTKATITGFVSISRGSVRLLARSPEDVILKQAPPQTTTIDLSAPTNNTNWQGYLFLGLLAILLGGAYLWERYRLPSPIELIKKFLIKKGTNPLSDNK
jgi:PKD repeat protein